MRSNVNKWLVWRYRFRQLCFGFFINISWITWKQTHKPIQWVKIQLSIEGHCSSFSPIKNLFSITFIWEKTVNRAEIGTSARLLSIKSPVAQKYISDLFGMPCTMSMEEGMTLWKTCKACMKWKISKRNNQRNSVAKKCQPSSKEGQPTRVSLKCDSVCRRANTRKWQRKESKTNLTHFFFLLCTAPLVRIFKAFSYDTVHSSTAIKRKGN